MYTEHFTPNNSQIRPKHKTLPLSEHRLRGIRRQHGPAHRMCYQRMPSLPLPSQRVLESDSCHRSDRVESKIRHCFAQRKRRQIVISRIVLNLDSPPGSCSTIKNIAFQKSPIEEHDSICVLAQQTEYSLRGPPRRRSDHRVRQRARKPRSSWRVACCTRTACVQDGSH